MKFGGTSVADLERIRRVARLVAAEASAGHEVVVVVSAMAGRTNEKSWWPGPTGAAGAAAEGVPASDDEYDVVVASGEQVSAGLVAMTLRNMGHYAKSWLAWQVPIITDDLHGKARIDEVDPAKLEAALAAREIPELWPASKEASIARGGPGDSWAAAPAIFLRWPWPPR